MMPLDHEKKKRLHDLMHLFLEENKKINLSAYRTEEQCWVGNILDSLACLDLFRTLSIVNFQLSIADVGTGGGFPLLPLAICLPEAHFLGIDATKKKVDAVARMKGALTLANVEMVAGRIEQLGHLKKLRGCFSLALSRAVAPIPTLLEYCMPLLKVRGKAVLWKSVHVAEEMRSSAKAMEILGARLVEAFEYELPEGFGKRSLLVYEKERATPEQYPREVGVPKAKPL